MSQSIAIARETLLDAPGLSESHLEQVMERLLSRQVDAADIFFQYAKLESWVLEDGIIKEGTHSIEQGAGLRAISGDKTGFAYTDSLQPSRLLEAAGAARAIAQAGQHGAQALFPGIVRLSNQSTTSGTASSAAASMRARMACPAPSS